jgi:integrase
MSTYQQNGFWYYRVTLRHKDGRRERVFGKPSLNSKKAAQDAEKAHVERLLNPPPPPAESFAAFAAEWLRIYPASAGVRQSTIDGYRQHLEDHLLPFLGEKVLTEISAQVVVSLFAHLAEKKVQVPVRHGEASDETLEKARPALSPLTIRNIGMTFHKILASAFEWGKIAAVPPFPKRKHVELPFDFYTADEAGLLLKNSREEDYPILLFALRTGARAGEQLALEWDDVDFANHQVLLCRSRRKNSVEVAETTTKTGRGRAVPLSADLEDVLRRGRHLRGPKVFCQVDGAPMTLDHLDHVLRRAQRKAGLRRVTWHDLRHSFASQAMIAGVQIRQVQEWLGHTTIQMTMRYAHLAPNTDQVRLVSLLDLGTVS